MIEARLAEFAFHVVFFGKAKAAKDEEAAQKLDDFEIQIPRGRELGDLVIAADGVSKAFDDNQLIENLTFRLPRGGIVGIIGPNGAGKTTTMRILAGYLPATSGRAEVAGLDVLRRSLDVARDIEATEARLLELGRSTTLDVTIAHSETKRREAALIQGVRDAAEALGLTPEQGVGP